MLRVPVALQNDLRELRRMLKARPRSALRSLWWWLHAGFERHRHPLPGVPGAAGMPAAPALRESARPAASIIIPAFNQPALTLACLHSLAQVGGGCEFEVIVVDDASTDPAMVQLGTIPGLVYLRNARNQGFVGSCNAGAGIARAPTLVFLNNDTLVCAGWLDRLLATLADPEVGLVGACLRYPDGRLQEAGGLVFADGSGWNYGRGGHPDDPRYCYRRDVDYCSGAAIAIGRELFERLGGFDRRYAPAYYEDADLAMAVRAAGLRVVYQPAASVVHLEGASAGTDLASGMKAHQPPNALRFRQKWRSALSAGHAGPEGDPDQAVRRWARHRVKLVCAGGDAQMADASGVAATLVERGCAVDLHVLGEWPRERIDTLRLAGVCVWPQDWRANARWHLLRTGGILDALIDDGTTAAIQWCSMALPLAPRARRWSGSSLPNADAVLHRLDAAIPAGQPRRPPPG